MNGWQTAFSLIGLIVRKLPKVRGKVRLGNNCYSLFIRQRPESFTIQSTLFPERLIFKLNMNCAHERMAYLMGHYEDETISLLTELWEGGVFLDIGANIGLISIPFAERVKEREINGMPFVYAIEVMPSNFSSLRKNIKLNNSETSITAVNIGLGAKETKAFIQIEGDDPRETGTANILPGSIDFLKIPITIKSIDEMVEEGHLPSDISLIKIDTDGYDYEVLKGARRVLDENRPLVFAELAEHCLNWHGYGIKEVVSHLERIGYETWFQKNPKPIRFTKNLIPDYQMNCLLVPQERANDFASYLL